MKCEHVILILLLTIICIFIINLLTFDNKDNNYSKGNKYNLASPTCSKDGKSGTCIDTKSVSCDGNLYSGLCPGSSSIKCCVPNISKDEKCNNYGGTCIDTKSGSCDGKLYSGLCSGSASIKCCVPNTLKADENCNDYGGTCKNLDINSCGAITNDAGCISPLKCCNPLNLDCIETPGGQRIQNNSELLEINSVSIQAQDVSLSPVILDKRAASAYVNMISQARKDGIKAPLLGITSGYRSDAQQKRLWDAKIEKLKKEYPTWTTAQIEKEASKWVAKPGKSNHRSGRTVDLVILNDGHDGSSAYINKMKDSKAWNWLNTNASKFGFYPYTVEPWHWEYNPKCI